MNENKTLRFFSVRVSNGRREHENQVILSVFDLDGPIEDPENPDGRLDRRYYGSCFDAGNFAAAIAYALSLGAVPCTEELWEKYFHEHPDF